VGRLHIRMLPIYYAAHFNHRYDTAAAKLGSSKVNSVLFSLW